MTVVGSEVLLEVADQTGVLAAQRVLRPKTPNRTHIPVSVSISAGTATVVIEGRCSEDDAWVELVELSESDIPCLQWCPEMQARLTAATDATVRVALERSATVVE